MKNAEQPASPVHISKDTYYGLTKREYFAAAAMQSLIQYYGIDDERMRNDKIEPLAKKSILIADALLKNLE